ncbi:hypothetical protein, partial [Enterobacter hormaechei]
QNDVTLKMPAFEWVHVQLHQQKGMISLSPPTICNSADRSKAPKSSQALTEANRIASPLNPVVMIPEDIRLKGNALTPALGCSRNYANPVPYGNKEEQQATGTT